jgi:hypothetical protein
VAGFHEPESQEAMKRQAVKDKVKINRMAKKASKKLPLIKTETPSGNKVNWTSVKVLYITRPDLPSMDKLADELGITRSSLKREASANEWLNERKVFWAKVGLKLTQKYMTDAVNRQATNGEIIRGALQRLIIDLQSGKLKPTYEAIDKMMRLQEFILGNPDSRPDGSSTYEGLIKAQNAIRLQKHREALQTEQPKLIESKVIEKKEGK